MNLRKYYRVFPNSLQRFYKKTKLLSILLYQLRRGVQYAIGGSRVKRSYMACETPFGDVNEDTLSAYLELLIKDDPSEENKGILKPSGAKWLTYSKGKIIRRVFGYTCETKNVKVDYQAVMDELLCLHIHVRLTMHEKPPVIAMS